jgi:hypothetical protein
MDLLPAVVTHRRVHRGPVFNGVPLFAVCLLAILAAGCQQRPALRNTFDSPESLTRAVVNALTQQDLARLGSLAVTEDEFRQLVWPKLPAARAGRNLPWSYVWEDLRSKSGHHVRGLVHAWNDRGFQVARVSFEGETTDYQTHRIHRKTVVTLRDRNGRETTGRLFGSTIEQNGRYKVFSYVVD